jgi:hypothetical protein
MEPGKFIAASEAPFNCPYPESDQSNPYYHSTLWRTILISFSHLRLGLTSGIFLSGPST